MKPHRPKSKPGFNDRPRRDDTRAALRHPERTTYNDDDRKSAKPGFAGRPRRDNDGDQPRRFDKPERNDRNRTFSKDGFKNRSTQDGDREQPRRFDRAARGGKDRGFAKGGFKKASFDKRASYDGVRDQPRSFDKARRNDKDHDFVTEDFTDRSRQHGDRSQRRRFEKPTREGQEPSFPKSALKKGSFDKRPRRDDKRDQPRHFEKPQRDDRDRKTFAKRERGPTRSRADTSAPRYEPKGNNVLLWGLHAARAAWLNPKRRIDRLWLTEAGAKAFDASMNEAREALLKRPDTKQVERPELDRLTPPGSVHQGIVIEAFPMHEPLLHDIITAENPPDLLLMLDQVTDPHNVGAILRSAAAFNAGALILTERNAPSTTGVLAKSASGALEHVPQIHVVNLARSLDELHEAGYWCVGLAEEGERELGQLDLTGRTVIVLGAEGEGLRQLTRKKCDELARLPTGGPVGSLNVSNAAAIALYEVRRQKK